MRLDEVSTFLRDAVPGISPSDLEAYRKQLLEDGFESRALLVHLVEDDFSEWKWKKAHKRAVLMAVKGMGEGGNGKEGEGAKPEGKATP